MKIFKCFETVFLLPVFFLFLFSCRNNEPFVAVDFIDTALFTSGIEGPDFDSEGNLYVVNFQQEGTIGKIDLNGKTSLFIELTNGSIGNGIQIDKSGLMYVADYTNHNILRIDPKTKKIEMYAHDSTMNQPNDLCISPSGFIYASDPSWSKGNGKLWRIKPGEKPECLDSLMGTTNGIEMSADGKKLFVNESVQRKIWQYDVSENGDLTNKSLFYEFDDFGLDGMRFDKYGRLYVARYGKGCIAIFSTDGQLITEVNLKGKNPTNLAFGGENHSYCFVTEAERKCIEKFKID